MKIVLASGNEHKCAEIAASLGAPFELVTQATLGVAEVPETGDTFLANATIKARHAAKQTGLPALADDSGIVVTALNGEPGVRSARYAGEDASDAANNRKLLQQLAHCKERSAHYHCTLVFVESNADPEPIVTTAEWHGQILYQERGDGGFGYDPLFKPDGMDVSVAELAAEVKARQSHRAQALDQMRERLLARHTA